MVKLKFKINKSEHMPVNDNKNNNSDVTSINRKIQFSETVCPPLRNEDQRPAQSEQTLQNHNL